jgi:catechol 2,3-dioxygenase-like lactoylglutathione lyase family enzyme
MAASLRFYTDGLGFRITHEWIVDGEIRWCWLQFGGAALMLQEFPKEGHDAWTPQCKVGEGVTLYFICDDAPALYRDIIARGLHPTRPVVSNHMWVTSLPDPDGYDLAFESPTDTPEGTEYTRP